MEIIVTYDVPTKHRELKKELFLLGYKDKIVHDGKYIYLPNTTLYHANKTSVQARTDVQNVAQKLSIKLERCIATIWKDWAAIYGEPFN